MEGLPGLEVQPVNNRHLRYSMDEVLHLHQGHFMNLSPRRRHDKRKELDVEEVENTHQERNTPDRSGSPMNSRDTDSGTGSPTIARRTRPTKSLCPGSSQAKSRNNKKINLQRLKIRTMVLSGTSDQRSRLQPYYTAVRTRFESNIGERSGISLRRNPHRRRAKRRRRTRISTRRFTMELIKRSSRWPALQRANWSNRD